MPLPERLIQPVSVSRGALSFPVPDELEGVTNGTLANVIRQLSSLSRHAEEMFGNLFTEAERLAHRSAGIQARIDRLAVQVTSLDSTVEEGKIPEKKSVKKNQCNSSKVIEKSDEHSNISTCENEKECSMQDIGFQCRGRNKNRLGASPRNALAEHAKAPPPLLQEESDALGKQSLLLAMDGFSPPFSSRYRFTVLRSLGAVATQA